MLRQQKITVVGVNTKQFRASVKYSFTEKAKFLFEDIAIQVKKLSHHDLIIVVLHEYTLFDNGKKIVPYSNKIIFENYVNQLVSHFNNLLVIAGSILYTKPIENKFPTLFNRYQESELYGRTIPSYVIEYNKYKKLNSNMDMKNIKYTKNHTYAACSSEIKIQSENKINNDASTFISEPTNQWHRNKVLPYYDSVNEKVTPEHNIIFKPGHLPNLISVNNMTSAVEICLEHNCGFIKKLHENGIIDKPLFHFVISSSTETIKENFIGKYNIHVDSANGTSILVNESIEAPEIELKVFSYNACVPAASLKSVLIKKLEKMNSSTSNVESNPTINNSSLYSYLSINY